MSKRPVLLSYYVTTACNARCGFCAIWQTEEPRFADINDVVRNCHDARKLGARFVDFTGGEPLLYPHLVEALTEAKRCGMYTSITTNTLLYPHYAEQLRKKIDFLLFSIDGTKSHHDANRGVSCYDTLCESLSLAKSLGERPELLFTVTDASVCFLDDVYRLARKYNVMLLLNPLFNYFGPAGLSQRQCKELRRYGRKPFVFVNSALLHLIENGGNNCNAPRCRAVDAAIIISPDNTVLAPCYHKHNYEFPIGNDLTELYAKKDFPLIRDRQGRFPECDGCTINCWFDPSFEYTFDRYMIKSLSSRLKYAIDRYLLLPLQSDKNGGHPCSR